MNVRVIWPGNGSLWLYDAHYEPNEKYGWIVQGTAYESIEGFNVPEGGPYLDKMPMWFPKTCVLEEEP